jgi:hypothetical protein
MNAAIRINTPMPKMMRRMTEVDMIVVLVVENNFAM